MPNFSVYSLQAICCFLIALICLWGATEWTASQFGFHPSLGAPWTALFGLPLYAPWSLFGWWIAFEGEAPHIFARAGALAALGGIFSASIAIGGGICQEALKRYVSGAYGSIRKTPGHPQER